MRTYARTRGTSSTEAALTHAVNTNQPPALCVSPLPDGALIDVISPPVPFPNKAGRAGDHAQETGEREEHSHWDK